MLLRKVGWRRKDLAAVVEQPRNSAASARVLRGLENGDVKVRARSLELEAMVRELKLLTQVFSAGLGAALCVNVALSLRVLLGATPAGRALGTVAGGGSAWAGYQFLRLMTLQRKQEEQRRRFEDYEAPGSAQGGIEDEDDEEEEEE